MNREFYRMQKLAGIITENQYIKLLEDQDQLNTILDKISDKGMQSLTPLEKKFLDKYSKGEKNTKKVTPTLPKGWKDDSKNIHFFQDEDTEGTIIARFESKVGSEQADMIHVIETPEGKYSIEWYQAFGDNDTEGPFDTLEETMDEAVQIMKELTQSDFLAHGFSSNDEDDDDEDDFSYVKLNLPKNLNSKVTIEDPSEDTNGVFSSIINELIKLNPQIDSKFFIDNNNIYNDVTDDLSPDDKKIDINKKEILSVYFLWLFRNLVDMAEVPGKKGLSKFSEKFRDNAIDGKWITIDGVTK